MRLLIKSHAISIRAVRDIVIMLTEQIREITCGHACVHGCILPRRAQTLIRHRKWIVQFALISTQTGIPVGGINRCHQLLSIILDLGTNEDKTKHVGGAFQKRLFYFFRSQFELLYRFSHNKVKYNDVIFVRKLNLFD